MEMLEAKADQPELLTAKDHNGLNSLHKVRCKVGGLLQDFIVTVRYVK